ncbi:RNB domain-containing ribonuclease [Cellulomonas edaphi]|uniref:RNB domain-containing ribonuclease n=1 Tax=Cellulomonas edaphi TaxID=3053468 RepID=A0ABT7S3W2_9CELL|nr:RNB domain-containing ribonuclease [Cellulomons edaphi]MDM7830313.1 RNB domain-containing ribonuclease [Cellulomons edaphi]
MPRRRVHLAPAQSTDDEIRGGLADLRAELDVPTEFPSAVLAEADARIKDGPLPAERTDATDVPFVTIDPPGSMDLDQAVHLSRQGSGFRVRYAIADVAAWVVPGGAIDAEARRRVVTLYAPDGRTPLHPPALSEGAASLLPDHAAPAILWTIDLDSSGAPTGVDVRAATVRSRAQLTYEGVQRSIEDGSADDSLALLRDIGRLREQAERDRGGITLPSPEQVVEHDEDGWSLRSRATLPVEDWNAQISLLTGMCAAQLMLDGRVGVLRTLPAAQERDVERLRRVALALGVDWPSGAEVGDVVRGLDAAVPAQAALLAEATTLLRGAAYVAFDGEIPEAPLHAAIAAPYAHATAPLRRLVDRFVGATCVALAAGRTPDDWVREALPSLPELMAGGDRRASAYERGGLDLVEAVLLRDRVGEVFDGVVVDVADGGSSGVVQLADPVVRARVDGVDLPLGHRVRVRLTDASVADRRVRFAVD